MNDMIMHTVYALIFISSIDSGANQDFWADGQTSLVSEKTLGKMGKVFIDGLNKILIITKTKR
jgi:hypothetical protein